MSTVTYSVPDISCAHCKHAIESEVSKAQGVVSVVVDVDAKTVTVVAEPLDELKAERDQLNEEIGRRAAS